MPFTFPPGNEQPDSGNTLLHSLFMVFYFLRTRYAVIRLRRLGAAMGRPNNARDAAIMAR
jgi:hypothetical protein